MQCVESVPDAVAAPLQGHGTALVYLQQSFVVALAVRATDSRCALVSGFHRTSEDEPEGCMHALLNHADMC